VNIVDLIAAAAINQTGGVLTAATLTGSAGTSASLTQPTNRVATLGAFGTTAGFSLVDDQALLVAGPVQDTGAASSLALTTKTGDITLAGTVSAVNIVDLIAAAAINQTGGVLTAATLTGSAGQAVDLPGTNRIGSVGNFTSASFTLNDSVDLLIAGELNAPSIAVIAPANQISVGDGATIVTTSALLQSVNFAQIGTSTVLGQGGGPSTLRISTTGTQRFDLPLGLQATGTTLNLDLHGGTAAGNVFVKALDVTFTTPGGSSLTGTIAGVTGGPAAAAGTIQPTVDNAYLFNGCVIGAALCTNIPVQPISPITPVAPITVSLTLLNIGLTATMGAIEPLVTPAPPTLSSLPALVVVALPMLQARPPELTDPDVVPPNITFVDY
jgi:hypothetical protein